MSTLTSSPAELEAFERELAARSLGGHWQMVHQWMKSQEMHAVVWRWPEILEAVEKAGRLIEVGGADDPNDRRTIHLLNPSLMDERLTTGVIQVAVQFVRPGETAEAHRHSQNALRFVVDAAPGVSTTVDGEQMVMEDGDLLLTPNWTWHDHTNASRKPAIWLDILDVNLLHRMGAHFKEVWPDGPAQPVVRPDGYARRRFATMRPRTTSTPGHTTPISYKWSDTLSVLHELARAGEIDPHEGVLLEYVEPRTGGPTFPTINCRVQMLPPHSSTRPLRRVGVTFYHVAGGRGSTLVGPGEGGFGTSSRSPSKAKDTETLAWDRHDCFMVPSWRWQEHRNDSDEPVYLFSIIDQPGLEAFGWYREEHG